MTDQATPKPRTTADVQTEYNNIAFKAGSLQFELVQRKKDLAMLNDTLSALAAEFFKLKEAETKAAQAKAPETPVAAPDQATEQKEETK